jgi:hypothetical protein
MASALALAEVNAAQAYAEAGSYTAAYNVYTHMCWPRAGGFPPRGNG